MTNYPDGKNLQPGYPRYLRCEVSGSDCFDPELGTPPLIFSFETIKLKGRFRANGTVP